MNGTNTFLKAAGKKLAVALGGTLLMLPQAALPALFAEATDAELAGMRGRFAPGGKQVVYFGVEMVTTWENPSGKVVDAGLKLGVDHKLQPTITVVNYEHPPQGGPNAAQDSGGNTVFISSGGITEVQGVAQSIQIGGDGNAVQNDIAMNITLTNGDAPVPDGGGLQVNGAGSQAFNNSNGTVTTVSVGSGGLSLTVNVPGQGQVVQQLRSGTGLFQGAMIAGDMNRIHNMINIQATLRSAAGLNLPNMQSALDSLKGMRQTGMF